LALVLVVAVVMISSHVAFGASNEVVAAIKKVSSAPSYEIRITGREPTAAMHTFVAPNNEEARSLTELKVASDEIVVEARRLALDSPPLASRFVIRARRAQCG
jgi:hypothetical protein